MMVDMENNDISIECGTCVATGTTACADCIVTHLLANDDGPIDLVTVPVATPHCPPPSGRLHCSDRRGSSTIRSSSSTSPSSSERQRRRQRHDARRTLVVVRRPEPLPSIDDVRSMLAGDGVTHVGVTSADVLVEARGELFGDAMPVSTVTWGSPTENPERSTDPVRAVARRPLRHRCRQAVPDRRRPPTARRCGGTAGSGRPVCLGRPLCAAASCIARHGQTDPSG